MMNLPKVTLEISRNNFIFKSSSLWNNIHENIFEKSTPSESDINMINGETMNPDFCTSVPFIKKWGGSGPSIF